MRVQLLYYDLRPAVKIYSKVESPRTRKINTVVVIVKSQLVE